MKGISRSLFKQKHFVFSFYRFWMKRENDISEPDNWTKLHPDGEDCASLGDPYGGTDFWMDAYCFEEKSFVCEAAAAV